MSTLTPDPRTPAADDDGYPAPLALAPLPDGLVVRAMAHIAAEARAGRARAVLPAVVPAALAPRVRRPRLTLPFLPAVLGLAAVALVAAGGFAALWLWRSQDPLVQAQLLLDLRQRLVDLRLALRLEQPLVMALALALSVLGLSLAALADRPAALLPTGRQA
jgi:hypothetical protein